MPKKYNIDWDSVFSEYNPLFYTNKEIADKLGIAKITVAKARVKYFKKSIRFLWLDFFEEYPPDAYSLAELAELCGKTESAVSRAIKKYYVKGKRARKKRKKRIISAKYILRKLEKEKGKQKGE